jgi:hypothetical protein
LAELEEAWETVRRTLSRPMALWYTDMVPALRDLLGELLNDAICIGSCGRARDSDIQELRDRIDALSTDD